MKQYRKNLLKKMYYEEVNSNNVPLQNVKNALGSIQFVKGNPLTKTEITLNIDLFYYKKSITSFIAPAALPDAAKLQLPVYLFGLMDYYSAFAKSLINIPVNPRWALANFVDLAIGIYDVTINDTDGFNPILQRGDLVICFAYLVDSDYRALIRVRSQNVPYGTFLNSFVSDLITINTLRYIVPSTKVNQFINPLIFCYQTLFGKTDTDTIDPRNYITNKDFQDQIADIPINLPIDKSIMLGTQINYDCENISMILFVEKVESIKYK